MANRPAYLDESTFYPPDDPPRPVEESAVKPAPNAPRPVTLGDYEILEEIARGGMGIVYKGLQKSLSRTVAIKMILRREWAGPDAVKRFHAEAEAAAQLRHPAIVAIYEVGEAEGHPYFTMEFIEGESLARRLERGPLTPNDAAATMKIVAEAVETAHQSRLIHRDLKPANILLDLSGLPHITDFGLACRGAANDLPLAGQVVGTPGYMPPEQADGRGNAATPAADIYSLGAVLYATLTARPPFQSASPLDTLLQVLEQEPAWPSVVNPTVPRDLEAITMKCLRKAPHDRYASAREFAEDLQRFLAGEPVHARHGDTIYLALRWIRKNVIVAGVSGTVALLMIVVWVATAWAYRNEMLLRVDLENRLAEIEDQSTARKDRGTAGRPTRGEQRNREDHWQKENSER